MTNIDVALVAWGIDPKYMSENEKIRKIYDKGFDNGLRFALNKVLEIITKAEKYEKQLTTPNAFGFRVAVEQIKRGIEAMKGCEQE